MAFAVPLRHLFQNQGYVGPRNLLWKVHSLDHRLASTRYRALLPIQALSPQGYQSTIAGTIDVKQLHSSEVIIFVRAFSTEDLFLAQRASDMGVSVVLDICDNISEYTPSQVEVIQAMAHYASVVTTNGPALASLLRHSLTASVPIMIVSDGIETETTMRIGRRMIQRAYLREVILPKLMSANTSRSIPKVLKKVVTQVIRSQTARDRLPRTKSSFDMINPKSRKADENHPFRTLIWFGRSGGACGKYGLTDIVDVSLYLEQLAQRINIRLLVVSNDRKGYEKLVQPLGIETQYIEWNIETIRSHVQASAVAIIPNSRDPIAICKSANRAVLALSLGVPVVASRTPAMEVFEGCVCFDDWVDGLYRYLTVPALVQDHLMRAQIVLQREFGPDRIARQWQDVLWRINRKRRRPAIT
jgi:hypothetical protein